MVSGSTDGSCIVWKLPDFKPIHRLTAPTQINNNLFIDDVALYDDYIVCSELIYITIWKSSLDNFGHQLRIQFNLQHNIDGKGRINSIRIHYGIVYSSGLRFIRAWNIETGQLIQEFKYPSIKCFTVNYQNLFVGEYGKLTVRDLQTNKIKNISTKSIGFMYS